MSAKEREMAELLAKNHREERLSAVMAHIDPDVSAILDLGCGIGALTTRLAEKFPSALIVGTDKSKYLLSRVPRRNNVLTVLGDLPAVPLKNNFFDVAIAIQVLHEIFHFKGSQALKTTFRNVSDSLRKNGEFIILDHQNPGDAPIKFTLPKELQKKLLEFQMKFKPRKVSYNYLGQGRFSASMRDFYDFVTKIWALNSGLEEEEMSETHTPFTCEELVNLAQSAGFKVTCATSLTSVDRHLDYYGIAVEPTKNFPNRHILLRARKVNGSARVGIEIPSSITKNPIAEKL